MPSLGHEGFCPLSRKARWVPGGGKEDKGNKEKQAWPGAGGGNNQKEASHPMERGQAPDWGKSTPWVLEKPPPSEWGSKDGKKSLKKPLYGWSCQEVGTKIGRGAVPPQEVKVRKYTNRRY